jgi:hypothetical protein
MMAVVALRFSLPQALRVGPDWILAPAVGLLLPTAMVLHEWRQYRTSQIPGYLLLAIVTADMVARVALLITELTQCIPHCKSPGHGLAERRFQRTPDAKQEHISMRSAVETFS